MTATSTRPRRARIRRTGTYARAMRAACREFTAWEAREQARRDVRGGENTRRDGSRRAKRAVVSV